LQTVSPLLGEHTDEILVELGRGEDVEQLRADGIVF
jgi:crotonobetainyl-CoA:carnitine CoA-transferase CaiB-like acyl-CoA transferase